jgi:hypothetical protein
MEKVHDKERFFKYVSPSTALKILERSAVRYSSPLIFNDPFDIQSGLHFPFDINTLPERVLQRVTEIVNSESRPRVDEDDDFGKALILAWKNRGKRELPEFLLRSFLVSLWDRIILYQSECQQLWGSEFLPRLRVFSVSEDHDNLLMWSHYAQNHTGAVFAFKVMAEDDNALRVAQPVIYRPIPPPLFSEEDWIGFILGTKQLEPNDQLFMHYAYYKSDIWAYEKEWRVWLLEPEPRKELFSDYALLQDELETIYLGCKMDPQQKEEITNLVAMNYPGTQVFQARRPVDEYRLYFEKL